MYVCKGLEDFWQDIPETNKPKSGLCGWDEELRNNGGFYLLLIFLDSQYFCHLL